MSAPEHQRLCLVRAQGSRFIVCVQRRHFSDNLDMPIEKDIALVYFGLAWETPKP